VDGWFASGRAKQKIKKNPQPKKGGGGGGGGGLSRDIFEVFGQEKILLPLAASNPYLTNISTTLHPAPCLSKQHTNTTKPLVLVFVSKTLGD